MTKYDFIIVGLGTAGSAACMTLARRGFTVLGIDQYHPPHVMASHHGSSRSVRRAYLEGTSYVAMALRSWELWRKLEKDSGKDLLVKTGNLTIGPPESPAVSGFIASARSYTIPQEYLSAAEVRKRWPQLAPPDSFVAGLEKEAGIVFPELSITTFLEEAVKAGATLVMNERVDRWTEGLDGVQVYTARKTYEADRLLAATGAWTNTVLGLPNSTLRPKRVPVHWVDAPEDRSYHIGDFPVNFWQIPIEKNTSTLQTYKEFYTLPVIDRGSKIKAAFHNGLDDCDPDTLLREVLPDETDEVREILSEFLPGLQQSPIASEVCLYSMTPDGHFYLGRSPGSCRVFGVALAGHGFKFAPVLGEILADLMADIPPAFDMELFSPDRFENMSKDLGKEA
ncbi:MAG: N-methyl-L-tryptophan oxidase [Desulfopila sp.]|jgi:sarcosine oxidase|nr:N-methyl-L-tryptophan oxidase [Desulfopila sp.]